MAYLDQSNRRIEVGEEIVLCVNRHADVIAQAGIDGQPGSNAPVVLNKSSERALGYDAPAVTYENEAAATGPNVAGGEIFQIAEADFAGTECVAQVVRAAAPKLAPKFKVMPADHIGRAVGDLDGLIWRGVQRPVLISAQSMLDESGNPNFRHSEIRGIQNAGIQPIGGRIGVVIGLHHLLPEPVVADAELVGEPRSRRPDPAAADHLGPRPCLRKKQRIDHGGVFFGLNAVAKEVGADEVALLGQVVIQLHDSVVLAITIVEIQIQLGGGSRIKRKQGGKFLAGEAAGCGGCALRERIADVVIRIGNSS